MKWLDLWQPMCAYRSFVQRDEECVICFFLICFTPEDYIFGRVDNIKRDLKQNGFLDVDWNILDRDRIQWWIFVNTAVEFAQVLPSEEKLYTWDLVIRLATQL